MTGITQVQITQQSTRIEGRDGLCLRFSEKEREALACIDRAALVSTPSEKASLIFQAASLLDPRPIRDIPQDRGKDPRQYVRAAECWERLGDLFLSSGSEINQRELYSLNCFIKGRPKYGAAICYQYGAFSMSNALHLTNLRGENWDLKQWRARGIALIDKSIEMMGTIAVRVGELFFHADFHQMLAELYEYKLFSRPLEDSDLGAKVCASRTKSAESYGKIVKKGFRFFAYHYNKALNLREAAYYVKTIGEASKLLSEAALSAAAFREHVGRSLTQIARGESEEERRAFEILRTHSAMQRLLGINGTDHPLPKFIF